MAKQNPYLKKAAGASKQAPASVSGSRKHGLGRGLDGLLGAKPPVAAVSPVVAPIRPVLPAAVPVQGPLELPIMDIERSPYQPRRDFKEEELRELAESLKNTGLVQPPTVRKNAAGKYELIAGERRLRAAQLAGWKKIKVNLIEADDLTAASMTTTENINREDLNPIEEARSYRTLQDQFGLTQQEVSEKVGRGRATVANSMRLLELPDEVQQLLSAALISVGHAKLILSLDDEKDRILFARDCVNSQLTVKKLEQKIERYKAPVPEKKRGTPDLPEGYVRNLTDKMKKMLGCAVRVTSGMTHESGRHTKGVLEIDFLDNDDLDRIIAMLGIKMD